LRQILDSVGELSDAIQFNSTSLSVNLAVARFQLDEIFN
jgi:hypothetical protein